MNTVSDHALLASYLATDWLIQTADGILTVRAGSAAPAALRPSGIVTAFNPASRPRDEDENRRDDAELRGRIAVRSLTAFRTLARGTGADAAAWDEPGWCVPGDVRAAVVALGAEFGQNAIVWIDPAGEVTLVCTRDGFCGAGVGEVLEGELAAAG